MSDIGSCVRSAVSSLYAVRSTDIWQWEGRAEIGRHDTEIAQGGGAVRYPSFDRSGAGCQSCV
jgi:hypothetical protein